MRNRQAGSPGIGIRETGSGEPQSQEKGTRESRSQEKGGGERDGREAHHGRRPRTLRRLAWILALLAGGGVAGGVLLWITLPDVESLRTGWPSTTAYMELRKGQAERRGERLRIDYRPVPLERIPESVRRAVLWSEDASFWDHEGVDWYELQAAVREAWREREPPRGASTLTMQLARNLFLSPDRSFHRKLRELWIAHRLEKVLTKRRILELYLNVVELGPGVFGVAAAAERYWGLPVQALDPIRAVELAATLPSPLRDNPETRTRRFLWRVRLIRERLASVGLPAGIASDRPTDSIRTPVDTMAPAPDTPPISVDILPLPAGAVPLSTDTVPRSIDTVPAAPDTAPASADTVPAAPDTAPASADTVPAAPDTAPASAAGMESESEPSDPFRT